MRIQYGRVSNGLNFFRDSFMRNYNLMPCVRQNQPCVQFGMYRNEDYEFYLRHRAPLLVVWCGSDSMVPRLTGMRIRMLQSRAHKHIVTHDFGSADLTNVGIPHRVVPITPARLDYPVVPRGDNVYFYSTGPGHYRDRMYGRKYLAEIKEHIGDINIIEADQHTYNKEELREVYKSCFIALRLTKHDGVPTTVLEMGVMGRKSVFNGSVPHNIHWKGAEDIAATILREYATRKQDNTHIAEDIKNYLNIGQGWLIV